MQVPIIPGHTKLVSSVMVVTMMDIMVDFSSTGTPRFWLTMLIGCFIWPS